MHYGANLYTLIMKNLSQIYCQVKKNFHINNESGLFMLKLCILNVGAFDKCSVLHFEYLISWSTVLVLFLNPLILAELISVSSSVFTYLDYRPASLPGLARCHISYRMSQVEVRENLVTPFFFRGRKGFRVDKGFGQDHAAGNLCGTSEFSSKYGSTGAPLNKQQGKSVFFFFIFIVMDPRVTHMKLLLL